ncbi:MAG: hypothetical protein IPK99_17185, partial [Flavobacteriales bacterium]|nr:hypothetical protein [Flavobacteriales bacterium]
LVAFLRAGSDLEVGGSESAVLVLSLAEVGIFFLLHLLSERLKKMVGDNTRQMLRILIALHVLLWLMVVGMCLEGYSEETRRRWPVIMIVVMQVAFTVLMNVRGKWVRALNPKDAAITVPDRKASLFDRFPPPVGVAAPRPGRGVALCHRAQILCGLQCHFRSGARAHGHRVGMARNGPGHRALRRGMVQRGAADGRLQFQSAAGPGPGRAPWALCSSAGCWWSGCVGTTTKCSHNPL